MPGLSRETVIVGGGPAGSALAILLAQSGRETMLLEKTKASHDKVCGEFLSGEALSYLESLGVDVYSLGAEKINSLRVVSGNRTIKTLLPFPAASLSRKRLDEALLQRARNLGVEVLRGRRVQEIKPEGDPLWSLQFDDGERLQGRNVFLATGKHDIRGWSRTPVGKIDLVAFKMHWRLDPKQTETLKQNVEVAFFSGGYAGLQLVEDDAANLCLLIKSRVLRELGGKWEQVLAMLLDSSRHLSARLARAIPLWTKPLALSSIPYGFICRHGDDLWRLGDQAAVIPSFTGDGMSLALHSAFLAAEKYIYGSAAAQFQALFGRQVSLPVVAASWMSNALSRPLVRQVLEEVLLWQPRLLQSAAAITRIPHRSRIVFDIFQCKTTNIEEDL